MFKGIGKALQGIGNTLKALKSFAIKRAAGVLRLLGKDPLYDPYDQYGQHGQYGDPGSRGLGSNMGGSSFAANQPEKKKAPPSTPAAGGDEPEQSRPPYVRKGQDPVAEARDDLAEKVKLTEKSLNGNSETGQKAQGPVRAKIGNAGAVLQQKVKPLGRLLPKRPQGPANAQNGAKAARMRV
jgi:hypothetical protein